MQDAETFEPRPGHPYRMLASDDFLVREKTEAERRQYAIDNAPITFTCVICASSRHVQTRNWRGAISEPYPGTVCYRCAETLGRSWGRHLLVNVRDRRDHAHMRSLAAVTRALELESRHGPNHAR